MNGLPLVSVGVNGGADYIKHSYYYQIIPNLLQCGPGLRISACKRLVGLIKKNKTVTQVEVYKLIKE